MVEKLSKFNGIFFLLDSSQSLFWIALREIYLQMEILSQVSTGPQNPNKTMKQHRLSFLFWLHHWNHCLIKGFCLKKLPSLFFHSAVCLHSCSFVCLISWNQIQWCRSPSSYKNSKWAILTEKKYSTLQSSWELLCRKQKGWCKIMYVFFLHLILSFWKRSLLFSELQIVLWTGNKGCTVCVSASCTALLRLAAWKKQLDFKKFCKYYLWDFFLLPMIVCVLLVLLLTFAELVFCGFGMSPVDFKNREDILVFAVDVVFSRN